MSAIIDLIKTEDLKAGDSMPSENALAEAFGVSRVIVREANRSLSALGIIEIANGRTARVSVPDFDVVGVLFDHIVHSRHVTVHQVLDVRRSIELRTVALAAMRRSAREAQAITDYADAMLADHSLPAKVMQHDLAFHATIATAARNPLFTIMVRAFEPVTRSTWQLGWRSRADEEERLTMIAVHRSIAVAVNSQDVAAAQAAMAAHFDQTTRALVGAGLT
ncbi:MAG: FadR family transcriptional regulator [Alphaproteobacteria bacterium]|nr:MAG: FadR family transcriptional regulator [Alphaproteobacteria bacterium]